MVKKFLIDIALDFFLLTVEAGVNKAGYTATLVACGGAGAVMEKVTGAFGQEQ